MENGEETSNVCESSLPELEDSSIVDKQQFENVLSDFQFVGAESVTLGTEEPVAEEVEDDGEKAVVAMERENGEAVVEEDSLMAETEMENEDAQLVAGELEDDEAAAEEWEAERGSGGENAELVGAESLEEDETPMAGTEMEIEMEVAEMPEEDQGSSGSRGNRRSGRNSRVPVKPPVRRTNEEEVCFICFEGGELMLCDRRNCNKAYHPSCVNRDEEFFRAKGRWNCGWHLCSNCEKSAHYMCYTCTFSLCKGCIKDAVIHCVRGTKGFCESCMKTVMLIESIEQGNKEAQVDFEDTSSWEYLFKDYWVDLKTKLSLSSNELTQAKNLWKESPEELYDAKDSGSISSEDVKETISKRVKARKRSKSLTKEADVPSAAIAFLAEGNSTSGNTEWASKELLEFVMYMKNGDNSILSQFDVQALVLEYIKRNELRDPRKMSQIICDSRLANLFGKARVGHFEMLKLLEFHFLTKEHSQKEDIRGTVVNAEVNQFEADGNAEIPIKGGKDRRRKISKKGYDRGHQSNVDDYAAIDTHNISLIYLRRKLMEDLLGDIEKFHDKVVGTFVRIRISCSNQHHDIYRLVQVVGTRKAAEPYKLGKRTTDTALEILNLNKTEVISIDTISNQEFTEDECKRLRQSIKCGLIDRLTVGGIQEKAMEVQSSRVNDWMEAEMVRISHLRDRASEKGRRKELRECVEKLQLLKTPDERRRRLEEIPEIHVDRNMDPSYESEEENKVTEDNRLGVFPRPRGSSLSRKQKEPTSPQSGNFSSQQSNNLEKLKSANNSQTVFSNSHSVVRYGAMSETSPSSLSARLAETAPEISEMDQLWYYQDPSGKVQGPFSVVQLRKWNTTGYFPADHRIWSAENPDNSILLTDVLAGNFQKERSLDGGNDSLNLPSPTPIERNSDNGLSAQFSTRSSSIDPDGSKWGLGSGVQSQAWGNAPAQIVKPNSSIPAPGQPAGSGQWVHAPSTVQNLDGNLQHACLGTSNTRGPPIRGSQTNVRPPAPPSISWTTGSSEANVQGQSRTTDSGNEGRLECNGDRYSGRRERRSRSPSGNEGRLEHNGGRYSGRRERGSPGGDPGIGGGKAWNRQSSNSRESGRGSSRPLPKVQRICGYYKKGHCKKGASCYYRHT